MNRRILSYLFLVAIVGANFYYFPLTIKILKSSGGPLGFGVLALPFTGVVNLLLITAILSVFKYRNNFFMMVNLLGIIGIALLSYLIYTIPEPKPYNERSFIDTSNGVTDTVTYNSLSLADSTRNLEKTLEELNSQEDLTEDDCVFNNDIKGLSTEAILKLNPTVNFNWNEEAQQITAIHEDDTVFISIGGCYHFNFIAGLRTNKQNFKDSTFWLSKAKWLASTFFWNSIGEDYSNAIDNQLLIKRNHNTLNEIHYDFPPDTTLTNIYYTGVTISQTRFGTSVEVGAYVN